MLIQVKLKSTIPTLLTLGLATTLITPPALAGESEVTRTGRNGRSYSTQRSWSQGQYNRITTGSNGNQNSSEAIWGDGEFNSTTTNSSGYERNTNATWGDGEYERNTTDSQGRSVGVRRSRN